MPKLGAGVLALALFVPLSIFAQQLRLVEENETAIDPTAYRAYYGQLSGEPHMYTFSTDTETPVGFILVVPDVPGAKTGVSATLVSVDDPDSLFLAADGAHVEWQRFFDTAGRDTYLAGPMIETTVPAGAYRIQVSSVTDDAQYVLIVSGDGTTPFSVAEIFRRYATVPSIKSDFFGKPAYQAYLTPLLLWPIFGALIILGLVLFLALVYRKRRVA